MALGAVVLAITGAEALYADMGHFGRRPIRVAWLGLVLPALVLNYFGQGALVLRDADRARPPLLSSGPGLAALAADRARHHGHDHRQPGGDLGRVLADPPGGAPGPPLAHDHRAHLGHRDRPDLHPARQLAADDRRAGAGGRLRLVEQPCRRLRHLGHRRHGDRRRPRRYRRRLPLGLGCAAGRLGLRRHAGDRPRLLLGQRAQDPLGRLAAPGGGGPVPVHRAHLAPRPRAAAGAPLWRGPVGQGLPGRARPDAASRARARPCS